MFPPIIIFVFLLLTRFFSHFHIFIEMLSKSMPFPSAIHNSWISGCLGYTKQDVILFRYDRPFLSPTPYGSLTSNVIRDCLYCRVLNFFVLLIHKERHDAPSLSLCSDGLKSDFGSLCFCTSSCSFQHLAVDIFLNLTVSFSCCLRRPMNVRKHLLWIIGYPI